jgi:hypothetical protein
MKRYTEEQLRASMNSMKTYIKVYDESVIDKIVENHIKALGGVELPSDDEIEKEARLYCNIKESLVLDEEERYYKDFQKYDGFKACAKWMRDKIQGGNK